jgi:hypothetical protein
MVWGPQKNLKTERGVILILVAVILFMILGFAALVIDLSYIYTTKNQLQVAADSAALAGAGNIVDVNDCVTSGGTLNDAARIAARTFASYHKAGGQNASDIVTPQLNQSNSASGDIVLGNFQQATGIFKPCTSDNPPDRINSIQVTTRRTKNAATTTTAGNNPPSVFFSKVLGTQISNVTATAVAHRDPGVLLWSSASDSTSPPRKSIEFSGAGSTVNGDVQAKGTVSGTTNTGGNTVVNGQTYTGVSTPLPSPPNPISYYANSANFPGGHYFSYTGNTNFPLNPLPSICSTGLSIGCVIYVAGIGGTPANASIAGGGITATITLVATGNISVSGNTNHLTAYKDYVLFLSGGDTSLAGNSSIYAGVNYIGGTFTATGNNKDFQGAVYSSGSMKITGSGSTYENPNNIPIADERVFLVK